MVFIFHTQLAQTARGVSVGDDTNNFRIAAALLGEIFDALAFRYSLRNAFDIRVDTVRGDFSRLTVAVDVVVVGVDQLTIDAVDGQVAHSDSTVVDVDFSQGFLYTISRKCSCGKHAEQHDNQEKHGDDSFFHCHSSIKRAEEGVLSPPSGKMCMEKAMCPPAHRFLCKGFRYLT